MSLLSAPSLSLALALMLVQKASSGITISSPSAPLPPPPPPLPSHLPHPPLSSLSSYPSFSLPSPPSPPHPSLSSAPLSPPHPSLSSSPLSPPHPSLSSSPLSPPLSPPSPPLLPPVSTHTIYHDSAIAFNQVTLARILQELEDRDVLSQDTGFRRGDTGTSSDLNHLATIAQGIQHMSDNVDNITHVLSSVILHIYPDLEDEPDLGQTSGAPQTDSPAVLRRTRNKSLSTEQKDADSERVPSRSLEPQGQQAEFRERGGPSQLEFLRATSDLLKSELEQSEIESHHLNLNLSQLEMEAQRLRERGHQLLGVRANDTEEERKLMRASLLEAAKLKKQLEEDLRDLQRDRDELERQNRDLAKHNEVLEKRESEIEEEIQREEQREVALYRERNSLTEATKKALLDKVILDQDVARLEQEKRKYRELTRGMARRVYELEARCRAQN